MKKNITQHVSHARIIAKILLMLSIFSVHILSAQTIVEKIVNEENNHSQLQIMAHELLDGIGPRLIGTPQMKKANDWAVEKYTSWGITARNEQFGEWNGCSGGDVRNETLQRPSSRLENHLKDDSRVSEQLCQCCSPGSNPGI